MRISGAKNTEFEVLTTRQGYRLATSVDGTLTGRGGDIVIIDDPLKPSDALSDSKRERVNDWFSNTLLSRLDDKQTGAIVIVMQRLHMDDLTGRLLRASNDWTLLSFPAIAEQDETIPIGPRRRPFPTGWRTSPPRARTNLSARTPSGLSLGRTPSRLNFSKPPFRPAAR